MITLQELHSSYKTKSILIKSRINEFDKVMLNADDSELFEEMVFCILTAGTSAKLCIDVLPKIKDIIHTGSQKQIVRELKKCYRFYNVRADYIYVTREFLKDEHAFKIRDMLNSFDDHLERRDYIAGNKKIKGIGYKEASHFLRNIGYKGYTILDKHIIKFLSELGVIKEAKTPSNRKSYLDIETKFKDFAINSGFDIDELDLLLWSEKTGTILK